VVELTNVLKEGNYNVLCWSLSTKYLIICIVVCVSCMLFYRTSQAEKLSELLATHAIAT